MEEVQGQITEIARTASERRRDLTEEEIQKLEELFEQMRNLAKGELGDPTAIPADGHGPGRDVCPDLRWVAGKI